MPVHLGRLLVALAVLAGAPAPAAQGQGAFPCAGLPGAGSFANPLHIGAIGQTTVLTGCSSLSSGSGFSSRYYSFDLVRPAPGGAVVATSFVPVPAAQSAVHPRLAAANGMTLLTSRRDGAWAEQPPAQIRYLPIGGLAPGRYLLGVEKIDSPLRSLQTPHFDLLIHIP